MPAGEVSVFDTDTSSNNCGAGCNLNGLVAPLADPDGEWEWVIRLADQGFDGIQTFSFDIANNGLTLDDWGVIGVRSQQLCSGDNTLDNGDSGCGGSDKSYDPDGGTQSIPEPSAILGLALFFGGLITSRRRKFN